MWCLPCKAITNRISRPPLGLASTRHSHFPTKVSRPLTWSGSSILWNPAPDGWPARWEGTCNKNYDQEKKLRLLTWSCILANLLSNPFWLLWLEADRFLHQNGVDCATPFWFCTWTSVAQSCRPSWRVPISLSRWSSSSTYLAGFSLTFNFSSEIISKLYKKRQNDYKLW